MMYVRKASRMAALSLPALLATPLHASVYPLPADGSPVVGTDTSMQTVYEDTLPDLAHRYSLGYYEIIRANPGVDVWLPGAGTKLLLPRRRILPAGPRTGLVVNLPEHRLYYYPKPRKGEQPVVITYPVSIGKMDWRTPLGDTHVIAKIKHPAWYPPESIRKEHAANGDPLPKVVGAGPDNPLGDFALRLAAGGGRRLADVALTTRAGAPAASGARRGPGGPPRARRVRLRRRRRSRRRAVHRGGRTGAAPARPAPRAQRRSE